MKFSLELVCRFNVNISFLDRRWCTMQISLQKWWIRVRICIIGLLTTQISTKEVIKGLPLRFVTTNCSSLICFYKFEYNSIFVICIDRLLGTLGKDYWCDWLLYRRNREARQRSKWTRFGIYSFLTWICFELNLLYRMIW